MAQPTQNPLQDNPNKSAARKARSSARKAADARWVMKGKNVVGPIDARGKAKVNITQNIREYTPLSEDEEKRRKQKSELKDLQDAIRRKFLNWQRLVNTTLPPHGNPYLFMQPFGFGDTARFFGRDEILGELLNHLNNNITAFLDGSGRTSVLQAGVIPALLEQGHLPLLVSVSSEPLEISIKKQLLPNIGEMEFLSSMSLTEFVRRVGDQLKNGRLFLLVDRFEDIYDQPQMFRLAFTEEWSLCVSGSAPDVHWLFSIPGGSTYLLNLFKEKVAINPNLITLQPLEQKEARKAMLGQARLQDIKIDLQVADTILNELDNLERSPIDPAQLQLVCYMLAGGQGRLVKHWTMEHYIEQGRVDGILRGYLDRTIGNLEPVNREPAWQLLAALIDTSEQIANETELVEKMKQMDVDEQMTRNILNYLEESHLVEYTTAYKLSSDSLRPSIQQWLDKRAAVEKIKEEVLRQVRNIGRSALRGLFGGAFGFMLAYWILPYQERVPITDPLFFSWYVYNLALRAMVGAIAGFFLILLVDLILASFKGTRNHLRVPAGMLAGAASFAAALVFHMLLHSSGNKFASLLSSILIEGASWGLVAGAGAVWIVASTRQSWLKLFGVSIVCGLVLAISDLLLRGLDVTAPFYIHFVSGMMMPLFLMGSALWGKAQV
jgi:hypothetical protein